MDPTHVLNPGPSSSAGLPRAPAPPGEGRGRPTGHQNSRGTGPGLDGLWAATAAAAVAAVLVAGCVSTPKGARFEEQSQVSVALAPQVRILVDNARGSVRLQPSSSSTVQVEARKRAQGPTEAVARDLARQVRVELLRQGEELAILVHYPEGLSSSSSVRVRVFGRDVRRKRVDVDLVVSVPAQAPVKVVTKSADLTTEGTAGPLEFWTTSGDASLERHSGKVTIHSTSGDVSVGRLDGPLEMSTTSGDLRVDQVSGAVALESTSGDLTADQVTGDLTVSTVSGDISADVVRGPVRVSTTSGDVSLSSAPGRVLVTTASGDVSASIDAALEGVSIESTSGDVSLRLPEPAQGRLEIVTASGEVVAKLPMALEQATRRRLVGVMGPGKASVAIHTTSGDIHVGLASEH